FAGESILEVIDRTNRGKFDALSRHRRDAPPWLAHVIGRALAVRVEERYADGHAFAAALRAGPAAMPPEAPRPLTVPLRLVRVSVLAVVGGLLGREHIRRQAVAASVAAADAASLRSDAAALVACLSTAVALDPGDPTLRLRRGEARLAVRDGAGAR